MRATYRALGSLIALLVAVAGSTRGAKAQNFPSPAPPTIVDTAPYGDPYLFRWSSGSQVVEFTVVESLYCEEADYGSFGATASVGDPSFSASGEGAVSAWDVGCNYIGSPTTRPPNTVQIGIEVVPQGNTLAALTRAAKRGDFEASVVLAPPPGYASSRTFPVSKTFGVLSGKLRFGGLVANAVYGIGYAAPSAACGGGLRVVGVRYDFGGQLGEASTIIESSEFGRVCATPTLDPLSGEYDLTITGVQAQPVKTVYMDWAGRLPSKLTFKVGSGGIVGQEVWVKLPAGVTAHREARLDIETYEDEPGRDRDSYLARPRGQSWVQFPLVDGTPVAGLDGIFAATQAGVYYQLVTREVPLGLRFDQLYASARGGVSGVPVDTRYLRRAPVHVLDTRHYAKEGPRSNDVYLAGVGVPDEPITVTVQGLRADLAYRSFGGHGATAFPRGDLQWDADARFVIESGRPVGQAIPMVGFDLEQKTACPGCGSASGAIRKVETRTVSGRFRAGIGRDGALLAEVQQSGAEIGWGPTVTVESVARPTFLRSGDLGSVSVVVLPGSTLSPEAGNPALALLGAWRTETLERDGQTVGVPVRPTPLTDPDVKRGNGFFAGLNLGPEVYADAQNQPDPGFGRLLGAPPPAPPSAPPNEPWRTSGLSIAFPTGTAGQYDVKGIPANNGTKFVVRSTVTGVFNTDAANAPQPQVYGYALAFSRFAFGLVDNTLAPTTWIDGGVTVHGHGEFSVPFTSLGLTCTGQLAGGLVDFARLTPQSLKAWKTPFDITSIGFVPKGSDTECSTNPRELQAGGGIEILSLSKDVELAATWTPAGSPTGTKLAPIQARMDKSGTDPGFLVHTNANDLKLGFDPANTDRGWFDFGAKVFVPFWEALDARLRLQNVMSGSARVAAPSLVVPKDFTPHATWTARWDSADNSTLLPMFAVTSYEANATQEQKDIVNSLTLRAKTKWVFELGGDVKWRPGDTQQSARFIAARPNETDLKVATFKSAVPFVTSELTRFTMGVDADLRKISVPSIPSLKIDLKDPETIKKIDDFLEKDPINLTSRPIGTALGGLRGAITDLAATVKGAFGPALKGAIKSAIEAAFGGLGIGGLLDLAATAVTKVQATAQDAITAVFSPLSGLVDQAVQALVAGPDQDLYALYDTLPAAIVNARNGAQGVKENAQAFLKDTAKVAITKTGAAIASAQGFLSKLGPKATEARAAVLALKDELEAKVKSARCLLQKRTGAPYNCPANGPTSIHEYLDVAKLDVLQCDLTKNPILKQVEGLKNKIYAVADKLAASGNGALNGLVTNLVDKIPPINGNKIPGDGLAKVLIDLEVLTKYLKDKVNAAYYKVVGDPAMPDKPSLCSKTLGPSGVGTKISGIANKAREFVEKVDAALGQAEITLIATLGKLTEDNGPISKFEEKLKESQAVLAGLAAQLGSIETLINGAIDDIPNAPPVSIQDVQDRMDLVAKSATSLIGANQTGWRNGDHSFLYVIGQKLAEPVQLLIGQVASAVGDKLAEALKLLPLPKKEEILQHITNLIVNSEVVDEIVKLVTDNLSFLEDKANELVNLLLDQLTRVLQVAVDAVTDTLNAGLSALLKGVTAAFGDFPIKAASIKGFADILGNQIMALQVDARFDMNKGKNDTEADAKKTENQKSAFAFEAQMKVESWLANGKAAACKNPPETDLTNAYDVSISASNLPFEFGPGGLKISKLTLGFAINDGTPIGLFGGINTTGAIKFGTFELRNIGFAAGAGAEETYIGARAQGVFESVNAEVAFFVGRTCNFDVLKKLDPEAGKFIAIPTTPEPFLGVFAHGSVQIPFISAGCMLKIAFGAEAALWFFKSSSDAKLGGMFGGSVTGKALCFVAIRGAVRVGAEYSVAADEFNGTGEFFAGGGIGFSCDEDTWTSVQNIRNDSGCATVDVSATAHLGKDGLKVGDVSTSGID